MKEAVTEIRILARRGMGMSTDKISAPTGRTKFLTHLVDCRRGLSRGCSPEQSTLSGLPQPVAVAPDLDDVGMVQQPVEHGAREGGVSVERPLPVSEREIGREDDRAVLVAFRHDLEEQVGLLLFQRQVSDLVEHEQPRSEDGAFEVLLEALLASGLFELQHRVRGSDEPHLVPAFGRLDRKRGREVALARPARSEQDDVLAPLDERQPRELLDARLGDPRARLEVELFERLHDRERGELDEHLAASRGAKRLLHFEHLLEVLHERTFVLCRLVGQARVVMGDRGQRQVRAKSVDSLAHRAPSISTASYSRGERCSG